MAARLKAVERENRELRHANEILRKASVYRKLGDEARLPAWSVTVLVRPGAGSFGPTLWSTLIVTRRAAGIAELRF